MKRVTTDGEIINDPIPYRTLEVPPPFFKTPWNHDRDAEANITALRCLDPSKTQQQFAADADINNILRKFQASGELNVTGIPTYQEFPGDGSEERDLQTEIVTSHQVETAWNDLSAEVRNSLKDPKTFADYVDHCVQTGDLEPLRKLGLANPEAVETVKVTGVPPAPVTTEKAPTEPIKPA